ncbi:hypothetical protein BOTBODRAFT_582060 [Botryobasidium botryosum FD-172 SS1]|uniref:Uncharacterized protein n=1 Tax=Botryobasidium botryosum (strain FD-172 SS1) TaxID=930990 RepID=A0A067N1T9_BOTB1|nr:hypothetical protein BOTBODRAFT_582060 [Botryobasidium botryosum FD-172 SS1]
MAARPPLPENRQLRRLQQLPPLFTGGPVPVSFDGQPLFSPGHQIGAQSISHFHPSMPTPGPQSAFFSAHQPPPHFTMHRTHPSVAHHPQHLATTAMPVPMTPAGSSFPQHYGMPVGLGGLQPPPFNGPNGVYRQRRNQSVSIGGPPKAPLGGPNRKHSPIPPVTPASEKSPVAPPAELKPKARKIIVKIPVETVVEEGENGEKKTSRPIWARNPVPPDSLSPQEPLPGPELTTAEIYPEPWPRDELPPTIDVFLPGKSAWIDYKRALMEEKLAKLGVERGSTNGATGLNAGAGAFLPQLHGRAASISSPADPALLLFKLNKLQQAQSQAQNAPLPSPLVPGQPAIFPSRARHGHSMSLAHPPSAVGNGVPITAFNPFGPNATLGSDMILPFPTNGLVNGGDVNRQPSPGVVILPPVLEDEPGVIHAPQGIVPIGANLTRPDFNRGFGLDDEAAITENNSTIEEEEEANFQYPQLDATHTPQSDDVIVEGDADLGGNVADEADEEDEDGAATHAFTSPSHSRHVSKASVALSLADLGRRVQSEEAVEHDIPPEWSRLEEVTGRWGAHGAIITAPGVEEWTGSEDVRLEHEQADVSDDESIGEWSNPSDEERARVERTRRLLQREHTLPRRLPDFPQPPHAFPPNDDDIISNPSEEGRPPPDEGYYTAVQGQDAFFPEPVSPRPYRPLPPIPHSRRPSSQNAQATFTPPLAASSAHHSRGPSLSAGALNPFAKPFVFGVHNSSGSVSAPSQLVGRGSPAASQSSIPAASVSRSSHSRQGSRLNAAAAEFKPGGFTFTLPPGGPTFPSVQEMASRPLPQLPTHSSPARAAQGREKRQRTSIHDIFGEPEESNRSLPQSGTWDMNVDFRFPVPAVPNDFDSGDEPPEVPADVEVPPTQHQHKAQSQSRAIAEVFSPAPAEKQATVARKGPLNPAAKPFTFSGFNIVPPSVPSLAPISIPQSTSMPQAVSVPQTISIPQSISMPQAISMPPTIREPPKSAVDISPASSDSNTDNVETPELVPASSVSESGLNDFPQRSIRKRPTIPDFKHPVSTNTVPAALFKALANADLDGPTRPTVRSRLSSHERFEHAVRPSLDDMNMPAIARRVSKAATVGGDAANMHSTPNKNYSGLTIDVPALSGGRERRLSLPLHPSSPGGASNASNAAQSESMVPLTRKRTGDADLEQYERKVESMLNEKMDSIRGDFFKLASAKVEESVASTHAAVTQLITTLKAQILDARTDGHAEADFELIRSLVAQGHQDVRAVLQQHINDILSSLDRQARANGSEPMREYAHVMEELGTRLVTAVAGSTIKIVSHIDAIDEFARRRPVEERRQLIQELTSILIPHINNLRAEPLDSDLLTLQLAEAVKPHISQLIDLASDKKETAALIVQHLAPLLNSLIPRLDPHAIAAQVAEDVSRATPAFDTHKLQEDVADLVVERISSRLEVRDRTINPETIAERVQQSLGPLLQQLTDKTPDAGVVENFSTRMESIYVQNVALSTQHEGMLSNLSPLPEKLSSAAEALQAAQAELVAKTHALSAVQELQELAAANADLQVQLGKARSAHGQVRSEKDLLNERLLAAEAERDQLRAQCEKMQAAANAHEEQLASAGAGKSELESALAQALAQVETHTTTSRVNQERANALEQSNRTLQQESQELKAKVQQLFSLAC